MSQRHSGYKRKRNDHYETPSWVTHALIPHLPRFMLPITIAEPAAGNGKIVRVLRWCGFDVVASDVTRGRDFLTQGPRRPFDAIITNPPYGLATEFIERSLELLPRRGFVALLLRTDFDHAKTRAHLFSECDAFWKKVVLTRRIVWFDGGNSPSENHAWFIWRVGNKEAPTLAYAA